ncbi:MAG: chorismate mutase [Acidobacteriia bacterium]|nr:chorismate mutase [Terriglobia bacterium]
MDLDGWRRRIDAVDLKLVELLNRRSRYALEIGKIKARLDLPVYTPSREVEVLNNVVLANEGPLDDPAMRRLFERIIDEARLLEREYIERKRQRRGQRPEARKRTRAR